MSKFKLRKKIINLRKKKYFEIKIDNNIINSFHKKINLSKNKIIGGYFPINFEFDCHLQDSLSLGSFERIFLI